MLAKYFTSLIWALALTLHGISSAGAEIHSQGNADGYEPAVLEVVQSIKVGDLNAALKHANAHLQRFPQSRIGHLLKADILLAMAGPLTGVGAISAREIGGCAGLDASAAKPLVARHRFG